jgi:hypothetical protein
MCYKKHLYKNSDFLGCDDSSIVKLLSVFWRKMLPPPFLGCNNLEFGSWLSSKATTIFINQQATKDLIFNHTAAGT